MAGAIDVEVSGNLGNGELKEIDRKFCNVDLPLLNLSGKALACDAPVPLR